MSGTLEVAYAAFQQWCPTATRTMRELDWALQASGVTEASDEWLEGLSPRWARGVGPDPFYDPAWNGQYHELRFEGSRP